MRQDPTQLWKVEQALDGSGNFHVAAGCGMSLREHGCWWRIAEKEFTRVWQSIAYYGGLLVESLLGVFSIRLYEEPRYDVIDRIGDRVEIRRYMPRPCGGS